MCNIVRSSQERRNLSMTTLQTKNYIRPLDIKQGRVDLSHGSGGRASAQLIRDLFLAHFTNDYLAQGDDGAVLPPHAGRWVMSTDSHVVTPLFFPGGDIGSLSVHGTINDVAMMGAMPLYLSASFILEEGFPLSDLKRIVISMAEASKNAGVAIVTGDTKVVEKGKGDGIFITTTAVGVVPNHINLSGAHAKVGDKIIVSGTLGDHGMAIMSSREGLSFSSPILSDTACLHHLVKNILASFPMIHVLRDPTRGGLATTLNEITLKSKCGVMLEESAIPIHPAVEAACELLGLDPLYVANEGKLVAICPADIAEDLLALMRSHPLGKHANLIGEIVNDPHGFVQMKTRLGGVRMVDWLTGEQFPRIC